MKRYHFADSIPTLAVALSEYMSVPELKKLAKLISPRTPARKSELVQHIIRYLDGDRLRSVWQRLDKLQQCAVSEVVHSAGTTFAADSFRAKYGSDPAWGSVSPCDRDDKPEALRFFFYGNFIMPDDLKKRLKAFVPAAARATAVTVEHLPTTIAQPHTCWNNKTKKMEETTETIPLKVHESERRAQREVLSVLRLVDMGKVTVSDKTRKPTSATIKAVTAILEEGDFYPDTLFLKHSYLDDNAGPIRAFAWPMILQAGNLAQLSGKRLQLTRAGRKAISAGAHEVIFNLWRRWINTKILDELSRIDCVKGQTGLGKRGLTALDVRRDAFDVVLGECPPQRWIATDEFFRFMKASGNYCAVTRNAWHLYISDPQYGSLGYEGNTPILDKRYYLCLLLEYATTLGLIDVALLPPAGARSDYLSMWGTDDLLYFSRYDGLMYFRINTLGAYCLDMTPGYTPAPIESKPVLRVLPNRDIVAIADDLEQGDRLALDAYALRVSDFVWKIEQRALLLAMERGHTADEIREFLKKRSDSPLPDTVVSLLDDLATRSRCVLNRGSAQLVECSEPSLAVLIANDSRTRNHCMLAGEHHLVVPASSFSAFKCGLRDSGYLLADGKPVKANTPPGKP